MSDDIVKRLRKMNNTYDDVPLRHVETADEAADEIERLRAQVARLREALSECAEELACVIDTRSTNTIYAAARAALKDTER